MAWSEWAHPYALCFPQAQADTTEAQAQLQAAKQQREQAQQALAVLQEELQQQATAAAIEVTAQAASASERLQQLEQVKRR
jgi:hypothetical protein